MKLLRMKPEYVEWTRTGLKTATTRTKNKGLGLFELATGSRYKPRKTGTVIEITEVVAWMPGQIDDALKARIERAEALRWEELLIILAKLNRRPVGPEETLYTHFYNTMGPGDTLKDYSTKTLSP